MPYIPPLGNRLNNLGTLLRSTRTSGKKDLPTREGLSLMIIIRSKRIRIISPLYLEFLGGPERK